ncbi:DUF4336 domain-containing protein [Leptothoe kymatousa]|uniref:DUF4336 domain-containing protein n=1 Tax=Leptothoe kymatousa TAU-MAC 1615 TaxID=2364775 RepID=A0ABS5Y4K0_9CYAN|nr:DUF4336 domain-containing protein [Leptothoe kymatousa]MBT9312758.1 DUF4336 domain-containing protein [Leptothoe kymatousa TAU-MAC 1615]
MNLTPIADNLWCASQPLRFIGLEIGTRMTVVRLGNGDLVLISPIALDAAHRLQLDTLGTVRHIIAPNLFHHMFVGQGQSLYPNATVWGVEGLAEKRPDLKLDDLVNQPGSFNGELDYMPFRGFASILPQGICMANETVFYHRPSRSLILTDIAFNFGQNSSLSVRLGTRILGGYNQLQPSRLEKWGTRDKATVADSVRQVLAWDFDRVIPAHGSIVETNGKAAFKAGYEWFLDCSLSP